MNLIGMYTYTDRYINGLIDKWIDRQIDGLKDR